MSPIADQHLSGVTQTLLIPLCIRALESLRPDALIKDDRAAALVRQLEVDPARVLARVDEESRVAAILRGLEFDRQARRFLKCWPEAAVIHIGCGLDARFERVDNGRVDWHDVDLPEVVELRRRLMGAEKSRQHLLACSVLDHAWLDALSALCPRPFLFLSEGVFMYFEETEVRRLVLALRDRFPGAELVCDALSPFLMWANNLRVRLTRIGGRGKWTLKRGTDVERWGDGIRLIDQWFLFASAEPRLLSAPRVARAPWVLRIPLFARAWGVFHYQLGGKRGPSCARGTTGSG